MGGVIAQIGVLAGSAEPLPLALILHKQARIQGIYVGSRKDFEDLNKAVTLSGLRPVVESFSWSRAREIFTRMEHASHFGKLALTVE
jgi:D-arabinose 1-dehydrogenase-like Zn-dependent alcohol dehydrogenase